MFCLSAFMWAVTAGHLCTACKQACQADLVSFLRGSPTRHGIDCHVMDKTVRLLCCLCPISEMNSEITSVPASRLMDS